MARRTKKEALTATDLGATVDPNDADWFSASATRNWFLRDPILDWLGMYGAAKGYTPDTDNPRYSSDADFNVFITDRGAEFEACVVRHLAQKHDVVRVAQKASDALFLEHAEKTLELMGDGTPVIHQAVLWNTKLKSRCVADLLVRSDVLNDIVSESVIEQEEAVVAPDLGVPHYRVVEVKFTTLPLRKDGTVGSKPAYSAQAYLATQALGRLQGLMPDSAYLLGRGWRASGNARGTNALERLGRVECITPRGDVTDLHNDVMQAAGWLRACRREGADWSASPSPTRDELRPNLAHKEDTPWHGAKKLIAAEQRELTLLWGVGLKGRALGLEAGLKGWDDPALTPDKVGVTGAMKAPVLEAVLEINRKPEGPAVLPARVATDEQSWREPGAVEFFVDFETTSDLDDDFSRFPDKGGQPLIYMVGCGAVVAGEWSFKAFTVDQLDEASEADVIDAWLQHMAGIEASVGVGAAARIFHWSHAEVSTLETAYNSAKARHPEKNWPSPNWYDFLTKVVRKEPIVFRGAFGFGLKPVANSLHGHGLIDTAWDAGPVDGLGAMVAAWSAARQAREQSIALSEVPLMREVLAYNLVDCKVMWEAISYLRKNH